MSKKCRAYSKSKLGLESADNRKAFYAGWDAALAEPVQAKSERKPLTDDRLWDLWNLDSDDAYEDFPAYFQEFRYVARIVELAHGIKEEKK